NHANNNIVWHSGNLRSNAQNEQVFLTKGGVSGYYQADTWIEFTGNTGLFDGFANGSIMRPNTIGKYGAWLVGGSGAGWSGFYDEHSFNISGMFNTAGNGGDYDDVFGRYIYYYERGNN